MGETTTRDIVIGLLIMTFAISAIIFMSKEAYIGTAQTNPELLTKLEANFTGLDNEVNALANNVNSSTNANFESESSEGWVTSACTSLLGDDNFFCAGIKTLNSVKDAPDTMRTSTNLLKESMPQVEIPNFVYGTLTAILTTVVIFVIISSLRRYNS